MASPAAVAQADDWARRGSAAVDAQDLTAARKCFERAAQLDRDNADRRFHLAVVLEGLKDFGAAASELTETLRINPRHTQAIRRLAALATREVLPADARLNRQGLRAALRHEASARETIADAAIRYLACREPLKSALSQGRAKGWEVAARALLAKRGAPLLRDDVLLDLLRTGIVKDADVERLLTAMRRILALEIPQQRFSDKELTEFATALVQQCWVNEYRLACRRG